MDDINVKYLWSRVHVANGQLSLHDVVEGDARDAKVSVASPATLGEQAKNDELEDREMVGLHLSQRVPVSLESVDGEFVETSEALAALEPEEARSIADLLYEHADEVEAVRE